ncbi:MAG: hypothetical protein ACSHX9_13640 [Luteolibacter sp.]
MRLRLLYIAGFLLITFLGINYIRSDNNGTADSGSPDSVHGKRRARESRETLTALDSHLGGHSKQREALDQLIARWKVELGNYPSGSASGFSDAQQALVIESVEMLGISDELVALIEYINGRAPAIVGQAFSRQLMSSYLSLLRPASAEVCQKLVEMSPDSHLRNTWIFEAARYCDEEQLVAFKGDPKGAQAAIFGHADRTIETDPETTLAAVASELAKGRLTAEAPTVLRDLAKRVPIDSDFAAIESSLPPDSAHVTIQMGRRELLTRWASVDPAAAVNHVMANPERIDPGSISRMMEPFLAKDLSGAIEWLQEFPPGHYLDAALVAGVDAILLKYPNEARELAAKIEDRNLRAKMLEKARD